MEGTQQTCVRCELAQDVSEFLTQKGKPTHNCRSCRAEITGKIQREPKEGERICTSCNRIRQEAEFYSERRRGYTLTCTRCRNRKRIKRREGDPPAPKPPRMYDYRHPDEEYFGAPVYIKLLSKPLKDGFYDTGRES